MWQKIKDAFKWLLNLPVRLVKWIASSIVFASQKVAGVFSSIFNYFFPAQPGSPLNANVQDMEEQEVFNLEFCADPFSQELAALTMQELDDLVAGFEEMTRKTNDIIQNERNRRASGIEINVMRHRGLGSCANPRI